MNKILFALGLFILLAPVGIRLLKSGRQEDVIATYQEEMAQMDKNAMQDSLSGARAYNIRLYEEGLMDEADYLEQLDEVGTGIMGSLEIPKINVALLIRHGTTADVLADSVGHMKESSLPVGGENTHSILSGHRGVPGAQLFTRLDELEEGDVFYIHVCNQKLCYRVCEIQTVRPEDTDVIAIWEGRDLVSLVTCTPYGLNTHRLVVTGERTEETGDLQEEPGSKISKWDLLPCVLAGVFLSAAIVRGVRKKKGQKKRRRKHMKKLLLIWTVMFLWICPLETLAANGNIEIQLPEGQEGAISYSKVGRMVNGVFVLEEAYQESRVDLNELKTADRMAQAAKSLMQYEKSGAVVMLEQDGTTLLSDLEEGVYLIHSFGEQEKEITPTLVFIPTWMESEKKMLYDVTVIPKFEENKAPDTGFHSREWIYLAFLGISFIIIVGLSCHNHFKCGKMSVNHLEMGGYTNGNDDDTENPRCPRRLGFSGCRSID